MFQAKQKLSQEVMRTVRQIKSLVVRVKMLEREPERIRLGGKGWLGDKSATPQLPASQAAWSKKFSLFRD